MTTKEEIRNQTYTSARFYETPKVENTQSESIENKMNYYKEVSHMGHHKHCHAKIHCKYTPTPLNTDKKIHPAGRGNILQGKVAFCEGLKAFPIGKRHCN